MFFFSKLAVVLMMSYVVDAKPITLVEKVIDLFISNEPKQTNTIKYLFYNYRKYWKTTKIPGRTSLGKNSFGEMTKIGRKTETEIKS